MTKYIILYSKNGFAKNVFSTKERITTRLSFLDDLSNYDLKTTSYTLFKTQKKRN